MSEESEFANLSDDFAAGFLRPRIKHYLRTIRKICAADTAQPGTSWTAENPLAGHCAVGERFGARP